MKILNNLSAIDTSSNLYRSTAQITDGKATFERTMYFESTKSGEDAVDVMSVKGFPQKYSAHPNKPNYTYYGNGTVEPIDSEGKYWKAVLQYSTNNPNSSGTSISGKPVTADTPPWDLKPDNISFTYPETTIPFELAYDKNGELTVPVRNTAGDKIPATRSACNVQMSFTFATKSWNINNAMTYGNTINATAIKVCGFSLPAEFGLLRPPEASYITVYEDGSNVVKWQYWSVTVTILFDYQNNLLKRKFLNVGDRARFLFLSLSDDPLVKRADVSRYISSSSTPSQICRFNKTQEQRIGGKLYFYPGGETVFCSWQQYVEARQRYIAASSILMSKGEMDSIYELQCEQEKQMPLSPNGYLDEDAVKNGRYNTVSFIQYPAKSWKKLNLPN